MEKFWMEFAYELAKYIVLIGIAVAGACSGAKLRKWKDSRDQKNKKEESAS